MSENLSEDFFIHTAEAQADSERRGSKMSKKIGWHKMNNRDPAEGHVLQPHREQEVDQREERRKKYIRVT